MGNSGGIMKTQCSDILNHLQTIGPISPLDALNRYGCFRLGARIFDLKRQGHMIFSRTVSKNKKTFSEYYMEIS